MKKYKEQQGNAKKENDEEDNFKKAQDVVVAVVVAVAATAVAVDLAARLRKVKQSPRVVRNKILHPKRSHPLLHHK